MLLRADSAFYPHALVAAVIKTGADVSITVRMDLAVNHVISAIDPTAWTTIKYTDAIYDQVTDTSVSKAQVAEVPFAAFTSKKKKTEQIPGRLAVRRIPDLNPKKDHGQDTVFTTWRFHAFFTATPADQLDTVTADQVHGRHAIIENVHADLNASALAHLPSGVFNANTAWLICAVMAFNLARAAALTKVPSLARAATTTNRRKLICVPARVVTTARRLHPAPVHPLALGNSRVSPLRHRPDPTSRSDLNPAPPPKGAAVGLVDTLTCATSWIPAGV